MTSVTDIHCDPVAQTSREEVTRMYMHPVIASQVAAAKRRDMLAQAEQDLRASQLASLARASRRAERAKRQMLKARRLTLRLRSELNQ